MGSGQFTVSVLIFYADRTVRTWWFFLRYYRQRQDGTEKEMF
jgi:hypothetical protein